MQHTRSQPISAAEVAAVTPNLLLAALPEADYARLLPHLRKVCLSREQVLHEVGEPVQRVFFLTEGIVSLTLTCQQGIDFELSIIGNEGLVGERAMLGGSRGVVRSQVQIAGHALQMPSDVLREEFRRGGVLQDLLLRQIDARLIETSQVALCNHLHPIEQKLARWLLTICDRAHQTELDLTQEFIGRMLATRRAGVTVAAGMLRKQGLVDYKRGHISILDPHGLEAIACECYQVIKQAMRVPERVLRMKVEG